MEDWTKALQATTGQNVQRVQISYIFAANLGSILGSILGSRESTLVAIIICYDPLHSFRYLQATAMNSTTQGIFHQQKTLVLR